jgi:hypothetical protein
MHFERVSLEFAKTVAKRSRHAANDNLPKVPAAAIEPYDKSDHRSEHPYSWQTPYKHALVELNRSLLPERIASAESAIFDRLRAMEGNADHFAERRAIDDAQRALHVLKRDTLRSQAH